MRARNRQPLSTLCAEHIAIEVVRAVQSRGNYGISSADVHAALAGAPGESAAVLRKLAGTIIKLQSTVIERRNQGE